MANTRQANEETLLTPEKDIALRIQDGTRHIPAIAAATTYPIFRDLVFGRSFDKYVIQGSTD